MRRDKTKEEDYKEALKIIHETPSRDVDYYISKISFMLGLSDDKADEMFWVLHSARVIAIEKDGQVAVK